MLNQLATKVNNLSKSTFSSLKIRNYRLYFIGQSISLTGTWMQTIGQAWLVLRITNSGTALGLVTALQFLPVLFFGPMGGVLADRFSKRKLLYITQAGAGALALILAVLVSTNTVQLWMIYVLATLMGLFNAVDNPTRRTFVIEMVGRKDLNNAVTLFSTAFNLSRIVGPAIAGAIIAGAGLASCFYLNAISYIAVLVCLYLMNENELHLVEPIKRAKGQLREGFKYVRNDPFLFNLLIMMAIIGTLTYEFQVNLPLLAKFTFNSSATGFALLNSGMGIGAVLGGLAAASRKNVLLKSMFSTIFFFGAAVILVAISPSLHIAILAMVIVGFFSIRFSSMGETMLQLESEPTMRSRVMSLWSVAFLGSTPIGGPIIGWIGEHANPRWGLTVSGLAAIIAAIYGVITLRKLHVRDYKNDSADSIIVEKEGGKL
ncbi:MAG TPA: MFS transporter [Ignavibacteriaceae bacterium]|nr:MFS transporter [Ignavibacteriaceae bacterium]